MDPTETPNSPDIIFTGCKEQRSQRPAGVRKLGPTSRSEPRSAPTCCRGCGEVPHTQSRGLTHRAPEASGPISREHPLPAKSSPHSL